MFPTVLVNSAAIISHYQLSGFMTEMYVFLPVLEARYPQ